ncbi:MULTISPECIES: BolA family protein [Sphingomonas]|uniref:BolA family protein n=1 Tax=Sphingomonas TaxID=13687 RepID=UPI000DEF8DA6|nr:MULTISPECIES: BolA family protein [Sphingomonas]
MNADFTGPVAQDITHRLTQALSPTRLELVDDSAKHHGHAGHNPAGESHFSLLIESAAFAGQSRIARQRLVYRALGELMDARVHALTIRAVAPGEGV